MAAAETTLVRSLHVTEFAAGARAMLPWLAGVAPFGLVIGVSAAQASISTLVGWLTGPVIYGGSAQIATIEMLNAGAAPAIIVVTALVINLRLILYSAAMAVRWRGTPLWWRATAAYLLVDPSFVVGIDRYQRPSGGNEAHSYYVGAAALLWVAWALAIGAGATLGAQLPAALHLDMVIPLYLVGEVMRKAGDQASRRAALAAGGVAVAAFAVPLHLGMLLAIIAGLAFAITAKEKS